ncbi:unnamed protein product [Scytosiphon promiscuus]
MAAAEPSGLGLGRRGLKRPRPPALRRNEEVNDRNGMPQHQQQRPRDTPAPTQQAPSGRPLEKGRGCAPATSINHCVGTGGSCCRKSSDGAGAPRRSSGGEGRREQGAAAAAAAAAAATACRSNGRPRRRTRPRARAATALALVLARAVAGVASSVISPLLSEHRQQQQQQQQSLPSFQSAATARLSSRLCSPPDDSRAYVTTIADNGGGGGGAGGKGSRGGDKSEDRLLGARVLAQSLRSAGAKGEVVVLVPLERATATTVDSLRRDGLTVQIVPRGLQSAGGEIVSEELMTKVFLWSLTSYDRVVFLDPRSLIQKNPDALFACEGFCAAGAVHSPSSSPPFAGGSADAAPSRAAAWTHGGADSDDDDDDDDDLGGGDQGAAASVVEKPLSVPPPWQPSTSVMVLEPSLEVHAAMLYELTKTPAVGSLEAQVFLSSFLLEGAAADAGDRCTPFEDPVETLSSDRQRRAGRGPAGLAGGGGDAGWGDAGEAGVDLGENGGFGGGGNGGGSFLEDALMPVVLLNGPHIPRCGRGRKRTAEGVCRRLPYTFAAPSTDFDGKNSWVALHDKAAPEPHIVHFADEDTPWKRLAHLHKPLFWKWNAYREQLDYPYGNFFAPWVLFFIPCVVLAFARVYYKTASGASGDRNRRSTCGGGGACATQAAQHEDSPSKTRVPWLRSPRQHQQQNQQQMAILPLCGMAAAYDGAAGASVGSLEAAAAARFRNPSGTGGVAVGADHTCAPSSCFSAGGRQRLPFGVCYLLSALAGVYGLLWFRAGGTLAREMVDASWHPVISVSVHDAWLCCALVLGLYVMDYLYYALVTRGRTVLKDLVVVVVVVTAIRVLGSITRGGDGSGGGGGSVVWAGAIGVGVVALGFGHGSRAGVAHHLSGRAHFRCVTASCVLGTLVSLAICYAGSKAHRVATRRAQSAAATAQMVFVALVYASVIGGAHLWSGVDEAASRINRSCSTASFLSDALPSGASGKAVASSASSSALTHAAATSERGAGAAGRGGTLGGSSARAWSMPWSLAARAAARARGMVGRRRRVAACVTAVLLWKASAASFRPANPVRHFEEYGQSCLESQAGFVEAGGKRLSRVCAAEQALRPVATGAYFEAFRQDKLCLEVAGGGFLTLGRVHVAQACLPENQFVFQQVAASKSSKAKVGGAAAAGAAAAASSGEYCVYNPTSGFYLSAQRRPRAHCGPMEHWRVRPAPSAPGLSGGSGGGGGGGARATGSTPLKKAKSVFSALLHPSFLSGGPLHTFYGYLLAATALLVARAVFSKLATLPCVRAAGRGSGGGGGGGGGGVSKHHRGLSGRQRSRGRAHSRSHSNVGNFVDTGYVGDAETGGGGYAGGYGGGNYSSSGSSGGSGGRIKSSPQLQLGIHGSALTSRTPSLSPVALGGQGSGWGAEVILGPTRGGEVRVGADNRLGGGGGGGGGGRSTRHHLKRESSHPSAAGDCCDGWLVKLFSGLVVVCDATLLAGLWCLVPAHFAQAMSALTRDHHSAIDQGLGMDSNAAAAGNSWSRSLGEGIRGPAEFTVFGEADGGDADSTAAASCDSGAWWLLSALVRWHLLVLVVAFCHLHGAVIAASSASSTQRWRSRRARKKSRGPPPPAAAAVTAADRHHRRPTASFWGLRSGEDLAMRLRTAMGVLTLLLLLALLLLPEGFGLLFSGLHAHPGWGRCAPAAGLDESWGPVSPLLVFAVLAAAGGVYFRAGSSLAVRLAAGVSLVSTGAAVAAAAGRAYLVLALAAVAMDWAAWAIAGVMLCVCYQSEGVDDGCLGDDPAANPRLVERESSGSTGALSNRGGGGGGVFAAGREGSKGSSARHRVFDAAARRVSPGGWVVTEPGKGEGEGLVDTAT